MSKIVSIATSLPPYEHEQLALFNFADSIHSSDATESRKLRFLYTHSGINKRYSVIPDYSLPNAERLFFPRNPELEPFPSIEERMKWYAQNAAELSRVAAEQCIEGKIGKDAITHLITVSCTGMSAPGLDLELMELMQLRPDIVRTSVNFMGCYAAIHALKIADAFCRSDKDANVLIVCTELCTLHFQKDKTVDNITSTVLFGDGCAAVLMQHNSSTGRGIRLDHFYSAVSLGGKKDMAWVITSSGFKMTLSGYVPDLLEEDFNSLLTKALDHNALQKDDISHWCIHPGGKKILEAIEKSAGLSRDKMQYAYDVLRDYGNMSSPTVLFVLKKILDELLDNGSQHARIFGAAFGPGLTMETFVATYE